MKCKHCGCPLKLAVNGVLFDTDNTFMADTCHMRGSREPVHEADIDIESLLNCPWTDKTGKPTPQQWFSRAEVIALLSKLL